MGALIAYTIKGAVMLTVLFATYSLLLSKQKCASLRRGSLSAIYILSLTLPLFDFSHFTADANSEASATTADRLISLASGSVATTIEDSVSFYDIAVAVALGGIGVLLLWHIICLLYMSSYYFRSSSEYIGGVAVRVVKRMNTTPFCFGSTVYVSDRDIEADSRMVIAHETSHARHRHYIDLLIGRSAAILQWWNPAVWLMLGELRQVHEFQADEDVLNCGIDAKAYQYMLVEMTVDRRLAPLGNGMGHSRLRSRLRMINRGSSPRRSRLLSVLLIPAVIIASCMLSSETLAGVLEKFENTSGPAILRNDSVSTNRNARNESNSVSLPEAVSLKVNLQKINRTESERNDDSEERVRIVGVSAVATEGNRKDVRDATDTGGTAAKNREAVVMSEAGTQVSQNGEPAYRINGRLISFAEIIKIDPAVIKRITVIRNNPDYPKGLVNIELLSPEDMDQKKNTVQQDSIQ